MKDPYENVVKMPEYRDFVQHSTGLFWFNENQERVIMWEDGTWHLDWFSYSFATPQEAIDFNEAWK